MAIFGFVFWAEIRIWGSASVRTFCCVIGWLLGGAFGLCGLSLFAFGFFLVIPRNKVRPRHVQVGQCVPAENGEAPLQQRQVSLVRRAQFDRIVKNNVFVERFQLSQRTRVDCTVVNALLAPGHDFGIPAQEALCGLDLASLFTRLFEALCADSSGWEL